MMIKKVIDQWNRNKDKLREDLSKDIKLNSCEYKYLVEKVVKIILNDNKDPDEEYGLFDYRNIIEVNNGGYQGTLLFLIHRNNNPSDYDYLITSVYYGSCSSCDTLMAIQNWSENVPPTERELDDYMKLCLDICENMRKPYKSYFEDEYDIEMKYEGSER